MAHVAIAGPFDFALTTERFRAFGIDRANVWHEGGLHRVVAGRELRIEAAPGGVDANPLDAGTEPVVHALVGLAFDLDGFRTWAAGDEVLATVVPHLAGFRPPLTPDPFEMLVGAITAQQVSLFSALAIRNRLIERFGEQVGEAWAFPARERIAAAGEEELFALGFSRRKAEYLVGLARSELDLHALAELAGRGAVDLDRRCENPICGWGRGGPGRLLRHPRFASLAAELAIDPAPPAFAALRPPPDRTPRFTSEPRTR